MPELIKTSEKQMKEEKPAEKTNEVKPQVEYTDEDIVIARLKEIGVIEPVKVADDIRNMSFYTGLVVRSKKVYPALIRANRKTGYVRSIVPIPKDCIEPVVKNLLEIAKRTVEVEKQMKEELEKVEKERRIERLAKRLSKKLSDEELQLLLSKLSNTQS